MTRPSAVKARCSGLSLLEMIVATTIMAMLMASVVVVVQSGYGVWNAYEQDIDVSENAYGVLRHVVRQLRQAEAITAISTPSDTTGNLSFSTSFPSGSSVTKSWSLSGGQVMFNDGSSDNLLATSINELVFVGYDVDGNQTTNAPDIRRVTCTVQVTLTQGGGTPLTVSTSAWIRAW